ncbi:hypothetical protein [Variibacter gotjawalensis]|uniref:hypothetical protein n=1 Tax=Variibacter gotjawalensis TaxID=1333996 RepID=UPI00102CC718|nr:hypothetical protein [Variibacter gotjawalensis]NIK47871.1 hypothetical protein [Variibacter gotjawalensis]
MTPPTKFLRAVRRDFSSVIHMLSEHVSGKIGEQHNIGIASSSALGTFDAAIANNFASYMARDCRRNTKVDCLSSAAGRSVVPTLNGREKG